VYKRSAELVVNDYNTGSAEYVKNDIIWHKIEFWRCGSGIHAQAGQKLLIHLKIDFRRWTSVLQVQTPLQALKIEFWKWIFKSLALQSRTLNFGNLDIGIGPGDADTASATEN
jgi:hypothetical protein